MATIVTLDQSVPALTADLGVSSPAENLALKNAMTAAGITTGGGGGGSSPLTTKGDLYTYATSDARLPVGTNGQTLVADSTQSSGMAWKTVGPLPNGNIVITTATLPTPGAFAMGSTVRLASFVMPRAGKVCIVGNCSFASPGFSGTFIGGAFMNILQTPTPFTSNAALNPPPANSIISSYSTFNSLGITGVLGGTTSVGSCTVAAGDVITFSGQVLNISSGTGNWMIADSVYSATIRTTGGNTFSYFYIE